MIEQDVVVTTKHGQMPSFAVHPDGPGEWPVVLLYMDAPGIREELRNLARRIARKGYYCLLPDMYYRLGVVRFDTARRTDAMTTVIRACINHLTNALVMDDTAAMLAFVDAQSAARPGPVGCVGYCMSGAYVTCAAAEFPHRIASAASLYGTRLVTDKDDSPHLRLPQVKGELYFGFPEHDTTAPPETVEALRQALAAASTRHLVEVFPNTRHGFCFAEREVYAPSAAEDVWLRLFDLLQRTLDDAPRGVG